MPPKRTSTSHARWPSWCQDWRTEPCPTRGHAGPGLRLLEPERRPLDNDDPPRPDTAGLLLAEGACEERIPSPLTLSGYLETAVGTALNLAFLLEIAAFAAAGGGAKAEARSLYSAAAHAHRQHGWDPNSVRVIRERTARLMERVGFNVEAAAAAGSRGEQAITVDEAVALATSLPARLSS